MPIIDALRQAIAAALSGQIEGIFAVVFFALTFACAYSVFYQFRIRSWPSTTGKLLSAETEEFGATEISPSDVDYMNSVAYEYVVDGTTYAGNRFSPWVVIATHNLKTILERQLDGLAPGNAVPVFYNPRKPGLAFLKRPGPIGMLVTIAAMIFCFMTPVMIFG
jgi:hypothetical protein